MCACVRAGTVSLCVSACMRVGAGRGLNNVIAFGYVQGSEGSRLEA